MGNLYSNHPNKPNQEQETAPVPTTPAELVCPSDACLGVTGTLTVDERVKNLGLIEEATRELSKVVQLKDGREVYATRSGDVTLLYIRPGNSTETDKICICYKGGKVVSANQGPEPTMSDHTKLRGNTKPLPLYVAENIGDQVLLEAAKVIGSQKQTP